MQTTVTLTAEACYGYGGKQYIARITGRDSKYTFARKFVGTKGGKRRESSEYQTDEPGLYVCCDIDRKGNKEETYYILRERKDGFSSRTCTREQAMQLAKLMDSMSFDAARLIVFPPKPTEPSTDLSAALSDYAAGK